MRSAAFVLAIALAGCAAAPAPSVKVGNVTTASIGAQTQMAADTFKRIGANYSPAKTTFYIAQASTDAFGVALTELMRRKGYAVIETQGVPGSAPSGSIELIYVVDQAMQSGAIRLRLQIAKVVYTRAYAEYTGGVKPIAAWTRMEIE